MVRGKIVMKNERNVKLSDKTRVENVQDVMTMIIFCVQFLCFFDNSSKFA